MIHLDWDTMDFIALIAAIGIISNFGYLLEKMGPGWTVALIALIPVTFISGRLLRAKESNNKEESE